MSARVIVKKYVCCIGVIGQDNKKKTHRSIPMPLEQVMSEIKEYKHDGVDAWHEEATAADLAPLKVQKQRTKERKARKRDIAARRLVP